MIRANKRACDSLATNRRGFLTRKRSSRLVRYPQRYDLVAMTPVDPEAAVYREHQARRVDFREPDQASVSQRHRPVAVPPHECSQVRLLFLNRQCDTNDSPL